MLAGTRSGYACGFILRKLADKPHNINQLAEALNIDYQTTSHYLDVLVKNGIITTIYDKIYFLSKDMRQIWMISIKFGKKLRGILSKRIPGKC